MAEKAPLKRRPNLGGATTTTLEEKQKILSNPALQQWAENAPVVNAQPPLASISNTPSSNEDAEQIATRKSSVPNTYYDEQPTRPKPTSIALARNTLAEITFLLDNLKGVRSRSQLIARYIEDGINRDLSKLDGDS